MVVDVVPLVLVTSGRVVVVVELVVVMSGRVVVVDVLVTSGRVVVVLNVPVLPFSDLVVVVDELDGGSVASVEEIDDEEVEILIVVVVTSEPLRFPHVSSGLLAIPKVACNPVVSTLATPDTLVELLTYEPQKVLAADRTIVQVDPAANETPDTVSTLEPRVGAATHVVETRV